MRAKKSNPGGYRLLMVAVVILLFIVVAAVCAGNTADGAAAESGLADALRSDELQAVERQAVERDQAELMLLVADGTYIGTERKNIMQDAPPVQTAAPVARYELGESERDYIERVVMAEAGAEDYDGQCLVAQCIVNTMEARDMSALEVVQEPRQYAAPAAAATDSVKAAVQAVFCEGYRVTSEPIRYFYAPRYLYSAWHENNLAFVLEHGGHRFFKEG